MFPIELFEYTHKYLFQSAWTVGHASQCWIFTFILENTLESQIFDLSLKNHLSIIGWFSVLV